MERHRKFIYATRLLFGTVLYFQCHYNCSEKPFVIEPIFKIDIYKSGLFGSHKHKYSSKSPEDQTVQFEKY